MFYFRFYQDGDSNSSRKLFRFSLLHIPVLMLLLLATKKNIGSVTKKPPSGVMQYERKNLHDVTSAKDAPVSTSLIGSKGVVS